MQGQTFDLAPRAIGLEFHKIGAAVANLSDDRSTLVFEPRGGASWSAIGGLASKVYEWIG
jgi:hypothetical protein